MPPEKQNEKRKLENGDTIERVSLRDFGGATGSTEERLIAIERAVENILRNARRVSSTLHFVSLDADPSIANEGDVAVVGGKLKVYTSGSWVVVGTQT